MRNVLAALLLSLSPAQEPPSGPVKCGPCQVSESGVLETKTFEGYSPFVYKDIAGLDTIGHGHLIIRGEKFVQPLLPEDAEKLLVKDMAKSQAAVNRYVLIDLWQSQFDALNSWTFNLGSGALQKSTMLKRVNASRHAEVPEQMRRYNKARDPKTKQLVISRGLDIRRTSEGTLYMRDELLSRERK